MLAADPVTGDIRRFLVGPAGCEITGRSATVAITRADGEVIGA